MYRNLSRRSFAALTASAMAVTALPFGAAALTVDEARDLVSKLIGEINGVINSGRSEAAMIDNFETIFSLYADVDYIALSALGPAGRQANDGQKKAFRAAFQKYLARKYGKRFREFIGGTIEVKDARPLKSFFEVVSIATLKGQRPFEVRWHVFAKSGKNRFFNIIIEGVNMLAAERSEIGALLDANKGDIGKLTAAMKG